MDKDMKKFIDTLPEKQRTHNVYHIQTFDLDNNLIDTKYGVNLMTNYGFDREIVANTTLSSNNFGLVIGTSNSSPEYTDVNLNERVPNSIAFPETFYTSRSTAIDVQRYNYFDTSSGKLIGRRLTGSAIIDYNYDWLTEPINIYEFGECMIKNSSTGEPQPDSLCTHALVYDENHHSSYFTKRPNERVVVYIYRTFVVSPTTYGERVYTYSSIQYSV